jgi:hypothetical protein
MTRASDATSPGYAATTKVVHLTDAWLERGRASGNPWLIVSCKRTSPRSCSRSARRSSLAAARAIRRPHRAEETQAWWPLLVAQIVAGIPGERGLGTFIYEPTTYNDMNSMLFSIANNVATALPAINDFDSISTLYGNR